MPSGSARACPEYTGPAYSATTKLRLWIAVAVASIVTSGLAPTGAAEAADGHTVFRPYGTPGGLKDEFEQLAARNPRITKLVTTGESRQGRDIVALKVSKGAAQLRDGHRPAVLYVGAQHAREWITPEMVRRLAHHVIDGYGADPALTKLVESTELWFVPVANPDGYDYSFIPGNRNWRKNLRDNNRDGRINVGDGVDLNRNSRTKWSYDDEGASATSGSETYRGPRPASEPETRAIDRLMRRVGFEFLLNYHSPSEQLLYGTAWQVDTPTPDDVVFEALAGDDAKSAVPGYDPDPTGGERRRQRRALRARPHRPRHAGLRPRDVVVRRRQARPIQPTSGSRASAAHSSSFPMTRSSSPRNSPKTSRSRSPRRDRPTTRTTRSRSSAERRPSSWSMRSMCPTATRRPSPSPRAGTSPAAG